MGNLLSRFYFLSKLTTSIILLVSLLFLGYLFLRAYSVDTNNSEVVFELTKELKNLSNSVEKNSIKLKFIGDTIIKNENSFNEFSSAINNLQENKSNKELLIQIKELFNENDMLSNKIVNLSKKIDLINNPNKKLEKNVNNNFPVHNLINLIKLKLESGINVNNEIQLLQNIDYSEDKISYLEKLQILSNKEFIGLNKLNKSFEKTSSEYLNVYYLKKNNNKFFKYLSNIVTVQPNFNGEIEDENIRLLVKVRTKLYEKNIDSALKYLLLVNDSENYFKQWINEANYFIEFDKILNKLSE